MVVLRESVSELRSEFPAGFIERVIDFSRIIGYSVEMDSELKLEFNPDRQDLLSFYSLEHAIECFYDGRKWKGFKYSESEIEFKIYRTVEEIRPFAFGFVAKGKPIAAKFNSLIGFQERLHSGIGKNRSKVAIGIHNLDKITPPVEYRVENIDSKSFETYDSFIHGTAREILSRHPKGQEFSNLIPSGDNAVFIEDGRGDVLSMPPVINGKKTALDEGTRNFFVDITGMDKIGVRNASILLMFEMSTLGYNIEFPRMTGSGKKICTEIKNYLERKVRLTGRMVKKVIGIDLSVDVINSALNKMGYAVENHSDGIEVKVPGNRIDVMGPVDIIEDIGKAMDFSKLDEVPLKLFTMGEGIKKVSMLEKVRDVMISMGFNEVMNFVVTSSGFYGGENYKGGFEILNPKSLDFSVIRDRLYPGMINFLSINKRRQLPQKIFEIGEIVEKGRQMSKLCVMYESSDASYSDVKSVLDNLNLRIFPGSYEVLPESIDDIIPGRGGLVAGDGINGIMGELTPHIIEKFQLKNPVSFFEIYL